MKLINTILLTLTLSQFAFAGLSDLQEDKHMFAGNFSLLNSAEAISDTSCVKHIDSEISFFDAYEGTRVDIMMYKSFDSELEKARATDRAYIRRSIVYANAGFKDDNACPNLGLSRTVNRASYSIKNKEVKIKKFNVSRCGLLSHDKINERKIKVEALDNISAIKITYSQKDNDSKKTCYYQKIK